MAILDKYDWVERGNTSTYYPKFESSVSRITVSESAIYVDYILPQDSTSGKNTDKHSLSEFEAVLNSVYEERLNN